jgi:hypothetical protein
MELLRKETEKELDKFIFWKLNEKTIFDLFADSYRWPFKYLDGQPTVEVVGVSAKVLFFENGYVNKDAVEYYYNEGHTIIISRVNLITEELREYSKIIQKDCQSININIYMSKGKKIVSIPLHNHEYDVIVKNVKGSSSWMVNGERIILKNQNTLCLPKFTNHEVVEIHIPKISLTCNLYA